MNGTRIILILVSIVTIFSAILIATENLQGNENSELEITTRNRTDGTVDFQVRTISYNGAYAPAHCLAIWVCDENDNFVRTLVRRAWSYIQHLMKWNEMTNGNYQNAIITGASPNVHTTWSFNWDCLDRFGEMIPDGNYKIYVEFTEDNSALIPVNGPWTMVEFTKGDQAQTVTPAENQFFQDINLNYIPNPVNSMQNNINSVITKLDNFPNPFNPSTEIRYDLSKETNVKLDIYNLKGQIIKTLISEYLQAGSYSTVWDGTNSTNSLVSSGIYLYKMQTDYGVNIKKCILFK